MMTPSMKILFFISFSLLLGFVSQDVFAETEMKGWLRITDSYSTEPGPHPYMYWFYADDQTNPYRLNPLILPSNVLNLAGERVRVTVYDDKGVPLATSLNPNEQFLDIASIELINKPLQSSVLQIPATVRSVTLLSKFSDVAVTPAEDPNTSPGQFQSPFGVATDSSDNIYVIEFAAGASRVQKFDSDGGFLLKFGRQGTNDGEFLFPTGIAVDSDGNIYVVEFNGNRVQKFDSNGVFLLKFGSTGTGDGEFNFPFGIAVDSSDNIYVADVSNHRIQKFDSAGTFQGWLGKCTAGANCDVGNQRSNGFMCTAATCTGLGFGTGDGQFNGPRGIAFDTSGNIYVVQSANDRIQKFDSSGGFLLKHLGSGSGEGQFLDPHGIAVDNSDNVYVSDAGNHRIQKFNDSLVFDSMWGWGVDNGAAVLQTCTSGCQIGLAGSGVGQLDSPEGIASGSIYVADANNDRVKKFDDSNGAFLSELGFDGSLVHDEAYYQDIFYDSPGSMKNYYSTSSYGQFTWNGAVDDWKTVANDQATLSFNLDLLITDAITAHEGTVDFCLPEPVTSLILIYNGNVDTSGSAFGSVGTWNTFSTLDECSITVSVSWNPDNGGFFCCGQTLDRGIGVAAHELGHNLGFLHTPPPPGLWSAAISDPYHDPNSVMSSNRDFEGPSALIMGQRDQVLWVTSENKETVADGTSATITLDFSNEAQGGDNPQMIIVPLSDGTGNSYIIEGHKEGLFNDTPQDKIGAIMYKHFPVTAMNPMGGNQYAYLTFDPLDKLAQYSLVATAGTEVVSDFDKAILEVGETFEDVANSVTVNTLSRNATSVTVFVSNNATSDMDGDGVPDESDNCPNVSNPGQGDLDADDIGDVCDTLNVITVDTTVSSNFTSLGNLIVQSNSLLTINSGVTVTIISGSNITIESGSGVLIKSGGTLSVNS